MLKIRAILSKLRDHSIEKLNIAGGEPLLHPNFGDILREAKDIGFVTSIVTNGSLLDHAKLKEYADCLDWVGLSIDSASDQIEMRLGRGYGHHVANVIQVAKGCP